MTLIPHDPLRQGGWEFNLHHRGPDEAKQLANDWNLRLPFFTSHNEWRIKHLDSGIEFIFSPIDAIRKWREESLVGGGPLASQFPSYASPLPPGAFDCAYVGKAMANGAVFSPEWEDIEGLYEQVVWSTNNEQISSESTENFYHERNRTEEDPLFHYSVPVYRGGANGRDYSCYFHLVVTHSGWFVSLCQELRKLIGLRRNRDMTMHCNFGQNIIYREIIERQSMFFEEELPKVRTMWWKRDDEMCIHFHEAKQFKVPGDVFPGDSDIFHPGYNLSAFRKLKKAYLGAVDIPDEKIGLLFADNSKILKSIEAETRTCIQIIPLFHHPYNPNVREKPGKVPRKAYIDGQENNIEHARSCLRKLLGNGQLCSTDTESESESESEWESETESKSESASASASASTTASWESEEMGEIESGLE